MNSKSGTYALVMQSETSTSARIGRRGFAARQLQGFQLIFFHAGKRSFDKPVRMVPLAQGRNLAPSGLKVTVPADIPLVVAQDGLGGFHGEFALMAPAQLPDTPPD